MNRSELFAEYGWPATPWLRTNFVYGIDAGVTRDGRSGSLSGPVDNALLHHLRATADVVLVSVGTAVAEDYIGVRLPADEERARLARGESSAPPLAVFTRSGRIGTPDRFLTQTVTPNHLVLTSTEPDAVRAAESAVDRSEGTMTLLVADGITDALRQLRSLGYTRMLCEGGPRLAGALAADGHVDEHCVTLSPATGGEGRRHAQPPAAQHYTPAFAAIVEGFVFTRWVRDLEGRR